MKVIVADSSTLITLLDTEYFTLLFKIFDNILISNEVYQEITTKNQHQTIINQWLEQNKMSCQTINHDDALYQMLIKRLDKGESESIVLAKQTALPLIIDEKKGRAIAKSLGIGIVGLVGIIVKLMDDKIISKDKAIAIIKAVEANHFRLSRTLKNLVYQW